MQLFLTALITAGPVALSLFASRAMSHAHPEEHAAALTTSLLACALFFIALYMLVIARCQYSAAYWGAFIGAVICIPGCAIMVAVVAGFGNSLGEAGDNLPLALVLPVAVLAISSPLFLGALIGSSIGNSRGERGSY